MEISRLAMENSEGYAKRASSTDAEFLKEVLLSIKSLGLAQSYTIAGERLRQLGHEVYAPELYKQWGGIFFTYKIFRHFFC